MCKLNTTKIKIKSQNTERVKELQTHKFELTCIRTTE